MLANEALERCLRLPACAVLDIGSGSGEHAAAFRGSGFDVTTISLREPADLVGDYLAHVFSERFGLIWASHVLEHQPNVGAFLKKCRHDLAEGGWLAVTVPPMKDSVVGGHVAMFNAGTLLYHLILAGFDCRNAMVKTYDYNVSVIAQNIPATLPDLAMDCGDIERLDHLFPMPVVQGFDGRIESLNWGQE